MTARIVFCPLMLLLSAFIGMAMSDRAAAQGLSTRIAYDQCGPDLDYWYVRCFIHVLADGSYSVLAEGVGPKWSPDGSRIAFTSSSESTGNEIIVVNVANGSVANLSNNPARDWGPGWSRDGRIAFVSDRDGSIELYVTDSGGANPTRLTHNVGFTGVFRWSPDGGRIAFSSDRDGAPEVYVMDGDGSNLTRLTYNVGFTGTFAWSPDGIRIAFDTLAAGIGAINTDGTNFVLLTPDSPGDSFAAFSPVDGRIAISTARFGPANIAVLNGDGTVTSVGAAGSQLAWSPDGSRLAFVGTTSSWLGRCYPDGGAHNADDFCMAVPDLYVINVDGTELRGIGAGGDIDWFVTPPGWPVAAFTADCNASTCDFDGSGSVDSDGAIASYVWQFGDGASASGAIASHTYTPGGRYNATLTVTDNAGATGTFSRRVDANAPPVASFTVVCSGPLCTFDGSASSDPDGTVASYYWLFGDGETSTAYAGPPTLTHTYPTGTFSATLIVSDGTDTGTQSQSLSVVNAPVVASFTYACYGLSCNFDGSGSSDPDGRITNYVWSFGDGTMGWGPTVGRSYAAAGAYTVTLTASDNPPHGTGTQSQTVTVANPNFPPVAWFTSACDGFSCSFNGSGSWDPDPDGTIASYAWNFGDGTTGSGATVSRTYAAGGVYTVSLTVTDNRGATTTWANGVTVIASPEIHAGDVVIYASDVASVKGTWSKVSDPAAAAGVKLTNADNTVGALPSPLASPENYFDATFLASAGTRYRVWLRIHPRGDSKWNDSVFVQFSDAVDGGANPIYRIGSPNGYVVNLWPCANCQTVGWGWQRNAYWLPDTGDVWFERTGTHTMRVQVREDGAEIDQIVLSPTTYSDNPPGALSGDGTVVPRPSPSPPGAPSTPGPANGSTNVGSTVTLTWSGSAATTYDLSFGAENPPPAAASSLTTPSHAVSGLASGATYFWQVVARNAGGITTGPLWSFTTAPAAVARDEIVVYASDIPQSALHGTWSFADDSTSPNGRTLVTLDANWASTAAPLANPADFVDVAFTADANTSYTVWFRLKALGNNKYNDALWVQFSDAFAGGAPVHPMNSTSGLLVNLATDASAGSLNNWGWQNGAYWLSQPATVTFPTSGSHTLRIQVREDGVRLDQIVLSSVAYATAAPGSVGGDATIVPKR